MKLYLSGPMTGHEGWNFAAFRKEAARLRRAGYEVINPADLPQPKGATWEVFMRNDIRAMMDADGVAVLRDWDRSRGAIAEVSVAQLLGMPVKEVGQWLEESKEGAVGVKKERLNDEGTGPGGCGAVEACAGAAAAGAEGRWQGPGERAGRRVQGPGGGSKGTGEEGGRGE